MSVNKYRLWFKENKYSLQDLRKVKYTALAVANCFSSKFKSRRLRDYLQGNWHLNPFFQLDHFLLVLVTVVEKNYICVLFI